MAEVERPRPQAEEPRAERTESRQESPTSGLSESVFARVGDRTDLAAMNTHTRGEAPGTTLEVTDPFRGAAGAGSPAGGVEEVAGARVRANERPGAERPGAERPDPLAAFRAPPTDRALLEQGIVKITPTFPGTGRFTIDGNGEGSGFLVNARGDNGPSKPGEQLIATADHVIEDRLRKVYQLGPNLFEGKSELSKEDLARRGSEVVAGIDNKKPHEIFKGNQDYARDELSYLTGNFDGIAAVSKKLDPAVKGITLDGLDEFRRQNTRLDVETAAGRFQAQIAGREPGPDAAVLRISKLTPEQQRKIGPNIAFETEDLQMGQDVKSVGFKKTVASKIDGLEQITSLGDTTESVVVNKPLEKGMSGGPTLTESFRAAGINHATGTDKGFFTPITEVQPLLKDIAEGRMRFRRSLQ
jgi:hypothetical protein